MSTCRHLIVGVFLGILSAGCVGTMDSPRNTATSATMVTLERAVHFQSPDGADVTAEPGIYQVEAAEEIRIRLVPHTGASPLTIQALPSTHDVSVIAPLALAILKSEDEQHVVLLFPDGKGLDAAGTFSGVRRRGALTLPPSTIGLSAVQQKPALAFERGSPPPIQYPVKTGCTPSSGEGGTAMRAPTAFIWIPPTAFTPDNTADYQHMVRDDFQVFDPSYSLRVSAPVSLPDGAMIREIAVLLDDNNPDYDLIIDLKQYPDPLINNRSRVPIKHMYVYSSCVQGRDQVMLTTHGIRISSADGLVFLHALIYPRTNLHGVRIGYLMGDPSPLPFQR